MAVFTRLEFGPLKYTAGWDLTVSPGIAPASIVINFTTEQLAGLESPIQPIKIFEDDDVLLLTIQDCHLVRQAMSGSRSKLARCTIQDRRWRWQFAYIDGVYNVPKNASGDQYLYEKTPQQLASLLLDAMGEVGYDVSALPNGERPEVNWQSARADQALMQLCGSLGCYPLLNYQTDFTEIHQINTGTIPEVLRVIKQSSSVNVKPQPRSLRVITSPALFQTRLTLEMVAQDTDGTIKPWQEVSYVANFPGGVARFQKEAPGVLGGISGTYQEAGETMKIRELAASSVYRLYRVSGQSATGSFSPQALEAGEFAPTKLEDLLPLRAVKLTFHTNAEGRKLENAATIHGRFNRSRLDVENAETGDQYPAGGFSVDTARGLVMFSQPTFILQRNAGEQGNLFLPAEIELETSYAVNKNGVYVRYEQFLTNTDQSSFGSFRLPVPGLVVRINEVAGQTSNNTTQVSTAAAGYLNALRQRFFVSTAQEIYASRILPLALNGRVRQITWSGGAKRPATTRISINGEHNQYIPRFEKQLEKNEAEFTAAQAAALAAIVQIAGGSA